MATFDNVVAQKKAQLAKWVVAGIVVRLPLCTAPVCLPVLLRLVTGSVYLLMFALLLEALLSWTNPHAPFAPVLSAITQPFLRPLRPRVRRAP